MGNEVAKITDAQKAGNLSVFSDADSFGLACRMADSLSQSTIVPKAYQGNPANCMIAIEMASRINTSPMMVMQNLYIVNGSPAWSSQWIIAMINNSKRYKTELKFDLRYDEHGAPLSCMAGAEDYNGNKVTGPVITMQMAKDEGWISKNGSKWRTMPEVMIRYRAASFFGRLNCPDMIMGIYSQEEVIDGFGDPLDESTPVVEADIVEDTRVISQEERQKLMQAIAEKFEDTKMRNKVYVEVLKELGLRNSSNMTVAQLSKAIELVNEKVAEESEKAETENAEKADVEAAKKTEAKKAAKEQKTEG